MKAITNEQEDMNRVFALLIDGDNVSPKYVTGIIEELTQKYGSLSYRRIYGDFTNNQKKGWKEVLLDNSITPIQQYANTSGKNSSDSALIIDAMDILYTGRVNGFCIVSSDGDFTRLATRLRESQMYVIVMGEEKTPRAIRMACDKFVALENLIEQDDSDKKGKGSHKKTLEVLPKSFIVKIISDIIADNDSNGRETHLGELGSKIVARYPDFDTRDYGYSSLSKFVEETSPLKLYKVGLAYYVTLREEVTRDDVYAYAREVIKEYGSAGMDISELSNRLHAKFPSFSPKTYGYSQFQKFVNAIPGTRMYTEGNVKYVVLEEL